MIDAVRLLWPGADRAGPAQRARRPHRDDLVAGQRAARLRQVPAPGRHPVQPGLHRADADRQRRDRTAIVELFESRFDPARVAEAPLVDADGGKIGRTDLIEEQLVEVASLDQDRILRSLLRPGQRHAAHERLPHRRVRREHARRAVAARPARRHRDQARPAAHPRPAAAAAALRDLGVLAAGRGRAPALRPGRPRRPALVGPARGLPHRGPRPGQGADGQERRHRADRGQGRLRRQAAARPGPRPRGLAGRGRGLLPHLHLLPARPHRQLRHRRRTARSRSCRRRRRGATTATTRTSSSRPTRAPPPSATSPTRSPSTTASGSATRSPAAARSATTTRPWASPRAARGSR